MMYQMLSYQASAADDGGYDDDEGADGYAEDEAMACEGD